MWDQAAVGPSIFNKCHYSTPLALCPCQPRYILGTGNVYVMAVDDDTAAGVDGEGDSELHLVVLWQLLVIVNTFFVARRNLTS